MEEYQHLFTMPITSSVILDTSWHTEISPQLPLSIADVLQIRPHAHLPSQFRSNFCYHLICTKKGSYTVSVSSIRATSSVQLRYPTSKLLSHPPSISSPHTSDIYPPTFIHINVSLKFYRFTASASELMVVTETDKDLQGTIVSLDRSLELNFFSLLFRIFDNYCFPLSSITAIASGSENNNNSSFSGNMKQGDQTKDYMEKSCSSSQVPSGLPIRNSSKYNLTTCQKKKKINKKSQNVMFLSKHLQTD